MTRIIENKAVCFTIFALFALAMVVNTLAGGGLPLFGSTALLMHDQALQYASVSPVRAAEPIFSFSDGPLFPPDPWDKRSVAVADGPLFPPDPWDKRA